jgi:hypothetical protein
MFRYYRLLQNKVLRDGLTYRDDSLKLDEYGEGRSSRRILLQVIFAVTVQACGEKHGTVMRTTHYST